jgi:hypothetical protein
MALARRKKHPSVQASREAPNIKLQHGIGLTVVVKIFCVLCVLLRPIFSHEKTQGTQRKYPVAMLRHDGAQA